MYEFDLHQHNFAVWAAAAAARRSWAGATTTVLNEALMYSEIRSFLGKKKSYTISESEFRIQHQKWCEQIKSFLLQQGLSRETISHGRLAKFIAVYLKSVVVLGPNFGTKLAFVIHPPIDRILIESLWRKEKLPFLKREKGKLITWTLLDEIGYYSLIGKLREWLDSSKPFWALEEYWSVAKKGS